MGKKPIEPGIFEVETADGVRFEVTYRLNGAQKRRRVTSLKAARDLRAEGRVRNKYALFAEQSLMPLGDYLDEWLRHVGRELADNTMIGYVTQLDLRFGPLYSVPLAQLTEAHINREIERNLTSGLAANSLHTAQSALISALDDAVSGELVRVNVARLAKWPKRTIVHIEVFSDGDLALFLQAISGTPREPLYLLLLETGLRISEALALEWRQLQLGGAKAALRVERTLVRDFAGGHWKVQDHPKTSAGFRSVPLSPSLVTHLERQRETVRADYGIMGRPFGPGTPVFTGNTALGRLGVEGFRQALLRLCARLRIPPYTPHAFRHTAATAMIRAGIDPKTVADRLGHADVRTVLDYYMHPNADDHEAATAVMESLLYGGTRAERRDTLVTLSGRR